jgi:hypothetical protein
MLFSVNAELEKQIADQKLEIKSLYENQEQTNQRDKAKLETLSKHQTVQEKMHIAKIQEVQKLEA